MGSKRRMLYLDILRVLSCIGVVGIHLSSNGWDVFPTASWQWQTLCAYNTVGTLGVAIFFMISGALYLDTSHPVGAKHMLRKALHLTVLYYGWLVLYNLKDLLAQGRLPQTADLQYLVDQVLQGEGGFHLWFLPSMVGLYLITPLLRPAFAKKQNCEYLLAGYVLVVLVLPQWVSFSLPGTQTLQTIGSNFLWTFQSLNYTGYFVLGHYLHSWPLASRPRCRHPLAWSAGVTVVAMGATVALRGGCSLAAGCNVYLNNPLTLADFMACAGLWGLVQQLFPNGQSVWQTRLNLLARFSLGVYLLHPAVLDPLNDWLLSWRMDFPPLTTPVQVLLVVALCTAVTAVLRKIPVIRYLVS